jgi:post-segregation antitoxin (ccd killing protein)
MEVDPLSMIEDTDEHSLRQRRRLHVRLSAATRAELARRAAASGIPVSSAARQLIEAELERKETAEVADADHGLVGLAALIAAEHAVLMVASVLPEGERRLRDLGPTATIAAEERLALLREGGQ